MTGVAMADAGMTMPVLAFLPDDDVFPFDGLILLLGKFNWLARHERHVGVEIVDSDERRWVVSGLCRGEVPKRRWWDFRPPADPGWEIEVQPLEPERFDVTRQRVDAAASALFDEGDEALVQIRTAATMAELSEACFQITIRAQGRRILAGNQDIPVRTADQVARRALMLFSVVRLSLDVDRFNIMDWLDKNDLIKELSPEEAELFAARRLSPQQGSEAGWQVEGLIALLWALGFAELPADGQFADLSAILEIVPPSGDLTMGDFFAAATLRPPIEIAAMAEAYLEKLRQARIAHAGNPTDETARIANSARHREAALSWILNPDRLNWP